MPEQNMNPAEVADVAGSDLQVASDLQGDAPQATPTATADPLATVARETALAVLRNDNETRQTLNELIASVARLTRVNAVSEVVPVPPPLRRATEKEIVAAADEIVAAVVGGKGA